MQPPGISAKNRPYIILAVIVPPVIAASYGGFAETFFFIVFVGAYFIALDAVFAAFAEVKQ